MKPLVALFALALWACSSASEPSQALPTVVVDEQVFDRVTVGNFNLTLRDREGQCALVYGPTSPNRSTTDETSMDVGIPSPCNFIGTVGRKRNGPPLTYSYGKGSDRRTVVLISGGPPNTEFPVKDELQPAGCGTSLAKLRIFADRIEKAWSSNHFNDAPRCPTGGADEVEFAT